MPPRKTYFKDYLPVIKHETLEIELKSHLAHICGYLIHSVTGMWVSQTQYHRNVGVLNSVTGILVDMFEFLVKKAIL